MVFFDNKGKEKVLKDQSNSQIAKMVFTTAYIYDDGVFFPVEFFRWHRNEYKTPFVVDHISANDLPPHYFQRWCECFCTLKSCTPQLYRGQGTVSEQGKL